jgi:hypothetical protein
MPPKKLSHKERNVTQCNALLLDYATAIRSIVKDAKTAALDQRTEVIYPRALRLVSNMNTDRRLEEMIRKMPVQDQVKAKTDRSYLISSAISLAEQLRGTFSL